MFEPNFKKIISFILVIFFLFSFLPIDLAIAGSAPAEYLCEFGIQFYRTGRYDDALLEFKKALILDPDNKVAQQYIINIFEKEGPPITRQAKPTPQPIQQAVAPKQAVKEPPRQISRDEAMNLAFNNLGKKETVAKKPLKEAVNNEEKKNAGIKISGEAQARFGITPQDSVWKRANWDLNEKNFRMLSDTAFDRRENTYDPRIYDRLKVNLDTENKEGLGFHSNIVVDPWSFTGKSDKITITGINPAQDPVELELKYWSNTGYTVNETFNTLRNGDSIAFPEIKVIDGHLSGPVTVTSAFGNIFNIPDLKIHQEFQPMREFWFDYNQEDLKFRMFPIAYENQALTFDDPLKLSNNRIWWENSPWINKWTPGTFNSAATPTPDFTKGLWDKTIAFFTRDSEGRRLTGLRGFSFQFNPGDSTYFATSVATPKDLWQEYSDVDNILSASRLKQSLTDKLDIGFTLTTRVGYNLNDENKLDATNFVGGMDAGYEIIDGIKASAEIARSQAKYDLSNSDFKTESRGNAYHFSIVGRYPFQSIKNTEYGYDGIQPEKGEGFFTKFRIFAVRMDESFDEPLSSYVETRDDESWGRHLHFRQPFQYYYQGEGQTLTFDDIKGYRIGNGIDIGRSTFGLRVESSLWGKAVENLLDVRNVHSTNGKFVENVSREELTWNVNNRLTTKALGIYHRLPKTTANIDPFVFDTTTRLFFRNDQIVDGEDPSIATGSLGSEYKFFDWLALNGIWEYTNDISLGYDNFPRGMFNTANRSFIFYEDGKQYRGVQDFLFGQQFFPKPPYPYYNIFKAGLRLIPVDNLELYLDYTRNPFEKAGQTDDNMNHIGFEVAYSPTKKIGIFFKYTYSRWQDLDQLTQGITKLFGHHNLFTEFVYHISNDEDFTLQYGEASRDPYMGGVLDIGWDPYGGALRTIDTQHIIRMYYRRKF